MNALSKKDVAITSEIAGTTRDVIEVRMDLGGLPITLLDTAGLRATSDEIEILGVERAKARAIAADIRVFLLEAGETRDDLDIEFRSGDIVAFGKADLVDRMVCLFPGNWVLVSKLYLLTLQTSCRVEPLVQVRRLESGIGWP